MASQLDLARMRGGAPVKCVVFVGAITSVLVAGPSGLIADTEAQNRTSTVIADTPRLEIGSARWHEIDRAINQATTSLANRQADRNATQQALRVRAFLRATTGRIGLAQQDLAALLAIDSRDRDARVIEGLMDLTTRPRNAVEAFSRAIQVDPGATDGYPLRAWALLADGKYREAVNGFDRAIQLDASDLDLHRGRAWARLFGGDYTRAIEDFTTAARLPADMPEAVTGRAVAHYLAGHADAAHADLTSAFRFRATFNAARAFNSVTIDDWQRFRRAGEIVAKRLGSKGDVTGWLTAAALHFRRLDDKNGMSEDMDAQIMTAAALQAAVKLAPNNADVLMVQAVYRSMPHDRFAPDAAIADLSEVIRLRPNHLEAYSRRAMLRAMRGEPLALADAEKAVALAPGDAAIASMRNQVRDRIEELKRQADARVRREANEREAMAFMLGSWLAGLALGAFGDKLQPHERFIDDMLVEMALSGPCRPGLGRRC